MARQAETSCGGCLRRGLGWEFRTLPRSGRVPPHGDALDTKWIRYPSHRSPFRQKQKREGGRVRKGEFTLSLETENIHWSVIAV